MNKNIFIIGAKGMGNYGGYETFVDKLTEYHKEENNIKYHVSWKSNNKKEFQKNNARCFNVKVPNIGAAQAIYYDLFALKNIIKYVKENKISNFIVYILACRIGPFMNHYVKIIHKLGGVVYINPDGHEWLRAKWAKPIKKYWKLSEKLMVKRADLIICDSINIEKYIKETYQEYNPKTTFIAYGAETKKSNLKDDDEILQNWYLEKNCIPGQYYLVVGRFVPENNYKTIIKEFMKSNTRKDLVIITNIEKNNFYEELKKETNFEKDKRIKFVGTVYEQEMIKKIRENAYAYIHGHSVGGTNPSLLEALGSTQLNLLYDVGFNKEVAKEAAIYWNLEEDSLKNLINRCDQLNHQYLEYLGNCAKERIKSSYSWNKIANQYYEIFTGKTKRIIEEKDLISIIVPIYNIEKYLRDCIHSLINQTYQNIEVILVDDGSKDESNKICDEYSQKYDFVKVIHKTNGGLSDARNIGMQHAKGTYISFVDGDDIIDKDYIKKLYEAIKINQKSIAVCGYNRFQEKEELLKLDKKNTFDSKVETAESYLKKVLYQKNQNVYSISAWGKLYQKEIFQNIQFPKGKIYEDIYVIADIISQVDSIAVVKENLYYYRITNNSITTSSFGNKRMQVLDSCDQLINRVNISYPKLIKGAYTFKYSRSFESIMMVLKDNKKNSYQKEYNIFNNIVKKYRFKIILDKDSKLSCKVSAFLSLFGNNISYYFYKKWKEWR